LAIDRKLLTQSLVLDSDFTNHSVWKKQRQNHQSEQENHKRDDLSGNRKSSIIPVWTDFLGETGKIPSGVES
jgi:hypothetical protein